MACRFEKLHADEHLYPYMDAVSAAEYVNGTFGTVTGDTFTKGAGNMCVMQIERGDDAYYDNYTVKKDEHIRVANMAKAEGEIIDITAANLPATYAVGNVLVADTTGLLKVGTGKGYEVIEVTDYGVRAVIKLA